MSFLRFLIPVLGWLTVAGPVMAAPQAAPAGQPDEAARKQQMCDCLTVLYSKTELVFAYVNREREVYSRVKIVDLQRPFAYVRRTDGSGIEECVVNAEARLEVTSASWTKDTTSLPIGPTTPAHGADACAYLKSQGIPIGPGTSTRSASTTAAGPTAPATPNRPATPGSATAGPAALPGAPAFGLRSATTARESAIGQILTGKTWKLDRTGSTTLGAAITLRSDGRVDGATGINARTWRIQSEKLVLCDANGVPIIVFNRSAAAGGKSILSGQAFPPTRDVFTLTEIGPAAK